MINPSFGCELLERYGSPLYVYDLEEAERRAKALFELLPKRAKLLYALKANPIADLCATLQTAGCRVEIAAVAELLAVVFLLEPRVGHAVLGHRARGRHDAPARLHLAAAVRAYLAATPGAPSWLRPPSSRPL